MYVAGVVAFILAFIALCLLVAAIVDSRRKKALSKAKSYKAVNPPKPTSYNSYSKGISKAYATKPEKKNYDDDNYYGETYSGYSFEPVSTYEPLNTDAPNWATEPTSDDCNFKEIATSSSIPSSDTSYCDTGSSTSYESSTPSYDSGNSSYDSGSSSYDSGSSSYDSGSSY